MEWADRHTRRRLREGMRSELARIAKISALWAEELARLRRAGMLDPANPSPVDGLLDAGRRMLENMRRRRAERRVCEGKSPD